MSDESAELLQLDTEPHVSARSCVELRHARVIAAERQSFPALTFLHAVHVAHVCASHILYAAVLPCSRVLWCLPTAPRAMALAHSVEQVMELVWCA